MSTEQTIEEIKEAIRGHGAWKLRLSTAIRTGKCDTDPGTVKCDDKCAFGKWLYGPTIDTTTHASMPYKVIKRLHAEFHECASRVLTLALSGDQAEAKALMETEYDERSQKLIRALTKWRGELNAQKYAA